ncbi:hypothetical protein BC830DRAFT_804558 [Chytriomyces sp. MP71]|nr:hypothetical protein BC830DRAFT_804558 [Chytriomyces sp. MP71]
MQAQQLPAHVASLIASLARFVGARQYADLRVSAFGESFLLHRVVVVANPYFDSIINGPWAEQGSDSLSLSFDDPNISHLAFRLVLARMYGQFDEKAITLDNVLELLATASFFSDDALCNTCVTFISSNLTPSNVSSFLAFSENNFYGVSSSSITEKCIAFLCKTAFEEPQSLESVSTSWFIKILASDCFYISSERARLDLIVRLYKLRFGEDDPISRALVAEEMPKEVESSKRHRDDLAARSMTVRTILREDSNATLVEDASSMRGEDTTKQNTDWSLLADTYASDPFQLNSKVQEEILEIAEVYIDGDTESDYDGETNEADSVAKQGDQDAHEALDIMISRAVILNHVPEHDLPEIQHSGRSLDGKRSAFVTLVKAAQSKEIGLNYNVGGVVLDSANNLGTVSAPASDAFFKMLQNPVDWSAYGEFPPFRFGYEFTVDQLEQSRRVRGQNVYSSPKVFYGGSLWMLYIKVSKDAPTNLQGGPNFGIFLQRDPARPGEDDWEDSRFEARVWFKVTAFTASSQSRVLDTKQNFKLPGCWGWPAFLQSSEVFSKGDAPPAEGLKCAVVLGLM